MSWTILVTATLLDVAATVFMKQSQGFTKLMPSLLAISFFAASIFALAVALKTLEVIPVYIVWVGLGTLLISVLGVMIFNEAISPLKLISVVLVILGVTGLIVAGEPAH